jgi:hypothetical protein
VGDFAGAIGRGIGGLVGGSIEALGRAFDTIVTDLQGMLPGPLFPITIGAIAILFVWWLFRK